jgi:penicillin-insensitive murein endopeptidase
LLFLSAGTPAGAADSVCFGRVADGRLEGGVKLPLDGANFETYSRLASAAGRTYVHSTVRDIVLAAYAASAAATPGVRYVYGETGWRDGGRFKPHRTHQNGLSVDFMVPVRDARDRPTMLPRSPLKRFGYDLEFDAAGRLDGLAIDFEALAEHLYQLDRAARARGSGLALVILERDYLPKLYATKRGAVLKEHVRFMSGTPWVRHDEHYHVDFVVRCQPLR